MAISYKSSIGKEDIKWWDGKDTTFTRETSSGGTITLTKYGHMVDVAQVYGNGTITPAILSQAISEIGSNKCTLLIAPGTWNIDSNVTFPANIGVYMPQGAIFNISSGVTLTFNSQVEIGKYQAFSGPGTVSFTSGSEVKVSWLSSLSTAISMLGSNNINLIIDTNQTVSANLTIPSNILLKVLKGNTLSISFGVTLTINGAFEAGLYQVFTGDGTVSFGDGSVKEVYPEWWGAVGDGTTICTNAFRKMFRSVNEGNAIIRLGSGVYIVDDEIAIPGGAHYIIGGLRGGTGVSTKTAIKAMGMSGNKALFRATASANNGYTCYMEGIELDANGLIDYCFIIEGSPGGTYTNTWSFKRCGWHYANKVGVLIGSIDGSVDVDSYQVNFNECIFSYNVVDIYANAPNNYGPYIHRCHFGSGQNRTINHVVIIKSGDARIEDSYFASLSPLSTIINPRTGDMVQDNEIYCIWLTCGGSILNCHTEESRVAYTSNIGNSLQTITIQGISINDNRSEDAQGRQLSWDNGSGAYTIYNHGALLYLTANNIWGYAASESSRRIYNNRFLWLDGTAYLLFGVIDEGSSSVIYNLNGTNPYGNTVLNDNSNFAYWIDTSEPCNISTFIGSDGDATFEQSTDYASISPYTMKMTIITPGGSFGCGLYTYVITPALPAKITVLVSGYTEESDWNALDPRIYFCSLITPELGTGACYKLYDPSTGRFLLKLTGTVNKTSTSPCIVFATFGGGPAIVYYDLFAIINGRHDLFDASPMYTKLQTQVGRSGYTKLYGSSAPTVGKWRAGDIIYSTSPTPGGYIGWVCVASGTPGTWKGFGTIAS